MSPRRIRRPTRWMWKFRYRSTRSRAVPKLDKEMTMAKKSSRRQVVPAILVVGVVAAGALAFAQSGKKPAKSGVEVNRDRDTVALASIETAAERKPLAYYTGGVRAD